mgnify:CR=1 FL=1
MDNVRRLFFALWPEEPTRGVLARLIEDCVSVGGGRPVALANMHITLVFMGDVGIEMQACIDDIGNKISSGQFVLTLDQLGYWAKPQVLWIGANECPDELNHLVEDLKIGLMTCGFTLAHRPYIPHLTLKRKLLKRPRVPSVTPICWSVKSVALVESRSIPGGVKYEVLRTWPLI